jgi:glyoxylase I family protein
VFFRASDPGALKRWSEEHLGVTLTPTDYAQSWRQEAGPTVFEPFPGETAQLRAAGLDVTVDPESYPNGRFARLYDPEGNPVELWEPI